MAKQWYYAVDGQQHGPVSASELKKIAGAGNLQPTDHVWSQGMSKWASAGSMKGLVFADAHDKEKTVSQTTPPFPRIETAPPSTASSLRKHKKKFAISHRLLLILVLSFGAGACVGWFLRGRRPLAVEQGFDTPYSKQNKSPFSGIPLIGAAINGLGGADLEIVRASAKLFWIASRDSLGVGCSMEILVRNVSGEAIPEAAFYVRWKDPQRSIPVGDTEHYVRIPSGIEPGETRAVQLAFDSDLINWEFNDSGITREILEVAVISPSEMGGTEVYNRYAGRKFTKVDFQQKVQGAVLGR